MNFCHRFVFSTNRLVSYSLLSTWRLYESMCLKVFSNRQFFPLLLFFFTLAAFLWLYYGLILSLSRTYSRGFFFWGPFQRYQVPSPSRSLSRINPPLLGFMGPPNLVGSGECFQTQKCARPFFSPSLFLRSFPLLFFPPYPGSSFDIFAI